MAKIVLASGSPRRQELLNRIGITEFDIRVPEADETYPAGLTPAQVVECISRKKCIGISEYLVIGGLSATEIIVVHTRKVIVDQ